MQKEQFLKKKSIETNRFCFYSSISDTYMLIRFLHKIASKYCGTKRPSCRYFCFKAYFLPEKL